MTLSNVTRKVTYTGNGTTTAFAYAFPVQDADDLAVTLTEIATEEVTTILSSQYSVTGIGGTSGGTVTYPLTGSAIAATHTLTIERVVPYVQELDLSNQSAFAPGVIEDQFDRLVMMIQQAAISHGINYRGDYSAAETYQLADVVRNQNALWRAVTVTTAVAPPTLPTESSAYWALILEDGTVGATGYDGGLRFVFSTSTSMADPGAGGLRLNHATPSSATAIAVDDTTVDSGNPNVEAFLLTWDDSTTTAKGHIFLRSVTNPQVFYIFALTSLTDSSGFVQYAVTYVAGSGALVNGEYVSLQFYRVGDKGADGAGSGDVVGPASSTTNHLPLFASGTGKLLKDGSFITDPATFFFAFGATLAAGLPGLKPSSTTLQARLGDDSAYAPMEMSHLILSNYLRRTAPVTKTGNATVAITENFLINNKAASSLTLTMPAAASFTGRDFLVLNNQAFTVISASSNVVPLIGGAAGTAICPAVVGAWALMISDGTNWIIMAQSHPVASTTQVGVTELATAAEYRANTAGNLALSPTEVWSSAAEVTLTDAATVAVDFSTFINAVVTLAGNRAMGNPTNEKVGQSGVIRIVQDATGSRTLSYGTDWEFAGGTAPVLTTTAAAQDLLFYYIIASNRVYASLVKAIA